jgi:transposase-like protein
VQVPPRLPREGGLDPESLAEEFGPSAPTIEAWVEAARAAEAGGEVVDKDARSKELERKLKQAEEEREIGNKAAAWLAAQDGSARKKGSRS